MRAIRILAKGGRSRTGSLAAVAALLVTAGSALAQIPIDSQTLAELRSQYAEALRQPEGVAPMPQPIPYCGIAPLASGVTLGDDSSGWRTAVDLYRGLLPSGNNGVWFWTLSGGEVVYWALDDGKMGAEAVAAGGGHVTEYEFTFGLHADAPNDTLRPFIVVSFYNAPHDPVADATNPVVEPPTPVSSIGWIFDPITLPSAGFYPLRTGLTDLAAAGLDFDLDETFYVEILPLEWSSYPAGSPVSDPDVFAVFTGPGTVAYGTNQNYMWSDCWVRNSSCSIAWSNGDGNYDHPAEMDACGHPTYRNQSGIVLRGLECPGPVLELSVEPEGEVCVGGTITVTLSMSCIPGLVRGYQAFLSFDPTRLSFVSGTYSSSPFGLHIIDPIVADGGNIDLAAGIDDDSGQSPTSTTADLATLTFEALTIGSTQVEFRSHEPPTRLSDEIGEEVAPSLVDSPAIVVDTTAPVITCPANINKSADAGDCTLSINPGTATATDECDASPLIAYKRSDRTNWNEGLLDPYPSGLTTITWRATDDWGNYSECPQTVMVNAGNELVVDVELAYMTASGTLTRCITFELWDCDTSSSATVDEEITFSNGLATNVTVLVPCGAYTCVSARDDLHTLRRTDSDNFGTSGSGPIRYVSDFTGGVTGDALIGGNLNHDLWIDILDFGVLSWQWGTTYDSNGDSTPDGHTLCGMFTVHADISGNGLIDTPDFTFIQTYFLYGAEADCCGKFDSGDDDGPLAAISVEELHARGMGELAAADLNGDGWVDEADIAAFADGVRPNRPVEVEPADLNRRASNRPLLAPRP